MSENNYYVTKERLDNLKKELQELKTVKRIEIAQQLKKAKELGDLSENAEYTEAREEKDRIENRISILEDIIKNSLIIKKSKQQDKVVVGSEVEVLRDGKKMVLFIVGSTEAEPEKGRISNESPIGKELLEKKIGDTITINTPKGKVEYKICKIN
ncbi:MAG: transcription elongation factor GreA [bacterium]